MLMIYRIKYPYNRGGGGLEEERGWGDMGVRKSIRSIQGQPQPSNFVSTTCRCSENCIRASGLLRQTAKVAPKVNFGKLDFLTNSLKTVFYP